MKLRFTARSNTVPPRSSTFPTHSTDLKVSSRRHSYCCAASGPRAWWPYGPGRLATGRPRL